MSFTVYSRQDAPEESRPLLESVAGRFGFVPNLFGVFAASPAATQAYLAMGQALDKAALSPLEQQVVFLSVSVENECAYCVTAHSAMARSAKVPADILSALRAGGALDDERLQPLASLARAVVTHRGWVPPEIRQAFHAAGYSHRHLLDVLTIVAMKTLSNYTNHLANTPLDEAFVTQAWHAAEAGQ